LLRQTVSQAARMMAAPRVRTPRIPRMTARMSLGLRQRGIREEAGSDIEEKLKGSYCCPP